MNLSIPQPFSRRQFIKAGAAASIVSAAGPHIIRNALSSSGEVRVAAWPDYVWPNMIQSFEESTGINVKLFPYGSNEELLNKLRASGGRAFDVVYPGIGTPLYKLYENGLVQELRLDKISLDKIAPPILSAYSNLNELLGSNQFSVPFAWGTEAISFDSEQRHYTFGELSFGDMWTKDNVGKLTVRANSVFTGIGLYLDRIGELPAERLEDAYDDEETMRRAYDKILSFAIEHKSWVNQFWNTPDEALAQFLRQRAHIGQTWETTGMALMERTSNEIRYMMPVEGGLAWQDGMSVPKEAENIDEAYAWINHCLEPEVGGMFANQSGYNSAALGHEIYLEPDARMRFQIAYGGSGTGGGGDPCTLHECRCENRTCGTHCCPQSRAEGVRNLWWYPPEPAWFTAAREEFVDRYRSA